MKSTFQIGARTVGPHEPTYFIADLASNHDGDLSRAKRLIELAAEAGADAAKFQNFQAPKIVSRYGFEKLGGQIAHQAAWKEPVYDVYARAAIDKGWTAELHRHCVDVGIEYMTSPYDAESVDLVDPHVNAYKIGSGDITFTQLMRYIASKRKPVLLATGASTLAEVQEAMAVLDDSVGHDGAVCLMQCNTNYTGSLENFRWIQLRVLSTYALLFPDALLGLSDHTPGHATVLGAVALGARVVEKHFTDDNARTGPDHAFSMTPATWRDMVDRTRELELALGTPEKRIEQNERESAIVQRRAMYAETPIRAGEIIRRDMLAALRPAPAGSFAPSQIERLEGLRAPRDYAVGDCLLWTDWR